MSEEQKEEEEQFFQCYLRSKQIDGAITVMFTRAQDHIEAGFAFCSVLDNFSRPRGKLIARGRLKADPITIKSHLNEENRLMVLPTLLAFFQDVVSLKHGNIEDQLHIRPWCAREEFAGNGDFAPWLKAFTHAVTIEYLERAKQNENPSG